MYKLVTQHRWSWILNGSSKNGRLRCYTKGKSIWYEKEPNSTMTVLLVIYFMAYSFDWCYIHVTSVTLLNSRPPPSPPRQDKFNVTACCQSKYNSASPPALDVPCHLCGVNTPLLLYPRIRGWLVSIQPPPSQGYAVPIHPSPFFSRIFGSRQILLLSKGSYPFFFHPRICGSDRSSFYTSIFGSRSSSLYARIYAVQIHPTSIQGYVAPINHTFFHGYAL